MHGRDSAPFARALHPAISAIAAAVTDELSLPVPAWSVLSDTGSENAGAAAAALLLAGFGRLASTGRIELPRRVLAVALRASRATQV